MNNIGAVFVRFHALMRSVVARAGLKLDDYQMAMVFEAAPYALEMANRVRQPREFMEEPALAFRLPGFGSIFQADARI